ncbi:MAG: putative DNA modification/repair radical SAM protein, partial [Coprococcus sp.]
LLRNKYSFNGYIHVKTIPGASDDLLAIAGCLADRISVNLELPTEESLKELAPNKSFSSIITPMAKVSNTIAENRIALGKNSYMERSYGNNYLSGSIFASKNKEIDRDNNREKLIIQKIGDAAAGSSYRVQDSSKPLDLSGVRDIDMHAWTGKNRSFAPAGQSTQMIIGASGESDYTLLKTTQSLYQAFDLKRVFYSAYIPINEDKSLPSLDTAPPLLREHRLYQADWLLRFYGFQADELLSEEKPDFNMQLDPKCDWAVRHLDIFPIEVQTAPYDMILRVPGIGPKSAKRIMQARRYGGLSYESLKKMGVVLKRAHYFITCGGHMMFKTPIEENYITRQLTTVNAKENWQLTHTESYRQMSLFDDFGVS